MKMIIEDIRNKEERLIVNKTNLLQVPLGTCVEFLDDLCSDIKTGTIGIISSDFYAETSLLKLEDFSLVYFPNEIVLEEVLLDEQFRILKSKITLSKG